MTVIKNKRTKLKVDNTMQNVEVGGGGGGGGVSDYSLEEVETGTKWIDGKSIYKKTCVHLGVSATLNVWNDIPESTMDSLVNFELVYKRDSTDRWYVGNFGANTSAPLVGFEVSYTNRNNATTFQMTDSILTDVYITYYYTKVA